jgi:hypothetical protein
MDVVLWVAVAFCLIVIVAAGVAMVVAGVLGARGVKAVRANLESGLRELNASTTELETRLEAFAARSDELQRSLDRLSESLRKVTVLVTATRDAQDIRAQVGDYIPKK